MTSASTLKAARLVHHYSGVFFAPAILFFAITGGLQMFGLHETSRGSSYLPPALLVHLSQLHKKGTIYAPARRPSSPAPKADATREETPKPALSPKPAVVPAPGLPVSAAAHNPLPMKVFFALTALGLIVSTCTGLFMTWKYTRRTVLLAGVFLAGILVPVLLLLL